MKFIHVAYVIISFVKKGMFKLKNFFKRLKIYIAYTAFYLSLICQ